MKHILFMLDYYLPDASANGICVSKLVREFCDRGIRVSILCYENEKAEVDPAAPIRMYTVKRPDRTNAYSYYLKWILPARYPVTAHKQVTEDLYTTAKAIVQKEEVDTIVCVHLPIETIIAGTMLKQAFPYVTMVAYMLDSLSGGFLPRLLPRNFCRKRKIRWENRLLADYDQIVLMESSRQHHKVCSQNEDWYPKARFLDIPALCHVERQPTTSADETITMCFVGTMAEGVRTPYAFLSTVARIPDVNIKIIFAGQNGCHALESYVENAENISVEHVGMVPYEQAQQLLCRADFLINLGNTSACMVPSKIFEYMSYGKPILSTYRMDDDSSLPYLRKYPASFLMDERNSNDAEEATRLREFILHNRKTAIPYESVADQLYANTPGAFYELLCQQEKGDFNEEVE